uniref:Uncharacterized protein n=1 Tax=Rhizophora mucronata TaxID=61149 RepID=A0A2P2IR81_RHIMU
MEFPDTRTSRLFSSYMMSTDQKTSSQQCRHSK